MTARNPNPNTEVISARLTRDLRAQVTAAKKSLGISDAKIVRMALVMWLKSINKEKS